MKETLMSNYNKALMFLFLFEKYHWWKELDLVELIVLVLEVVLLIIKLKVNPEDAARATAEKHGVAFARLWRAIPKHMK